MSAVRAMRPGIPAVCPGSPAALLRKATCQRERRRRWHQSRQAAGVMATTAPIRLRRNRPGRLVMAITGASTRANHPDYTDRNRLEQRRRDRRRRMARLAKMDASTPIHPVPSGTYRLLSEAGGISQRWTRGRSKSPISRDYAASGEAGAILQREDVIGAAGPPC